MRGGVAFARASVRPTCAVFDCELTASLNKAFETRNNA